MGAAISYSVCVVMLGVAGLVANLALIAVVYLKVVQRTLFHHTLVSLSFADIIASVGSCIFGLVYLLGPRNKDKTFSLISNISLFCVYFSNLVCFMHLVFIAIQRAVATIFPLKFKQIFFGCRFYLVIVFVWVFSVVVLFLVAIKVLRLYVIGYVGMAAFLALVILYVFICIHVRKQRKNIKSSSSQGRTHRSNYIVLLHSLAVTVSFIFCVLPSAIFAMLKFPGGFPAFAAVTSLLVINPLLDPMVYFFISHYRSRGMDRQQNASPNQNNALSSKTKSQQVTSI